MIPLFLLFATASSSRASENWVKGLLGGFCMGGVTSWTVISAWIRLGICIATMLGIGLVYYSRLDERAEFVEIFLILALPRS